MKFKVVVLFLLFVSVTLFGYTYEKKKELNLSAAGIENLDADCGAGYLIIKGEEGLKQVEVKATIIIRGFDKDDAEFFVKDKIILSLEKRGDSAALVSKVKSSTFKRPKSVQINLDVRVPKNLSLDIDDGSGSIEIFDIGNNVKIEDGSGSIEVENVAGNVSIDDGSGSIRAEKIKGSLEIDDGSGEIKVRDISGDVDVDDNSGDIKIYGIGGSVIVDDGSGGIYIDGVAKNVTIKSAGSGSVSIQNVKGVVKK